MSNKKIILKEFYDMLKEELLSETADYTDLREDQKNAKKSKRNAAIIKEFLKMISEP